MGHKVAQGLHTNIWVRVRVRVRVRVTVRVRVNKAATGC